MERQFQIDRFREGLKLVKRNTGQRLRPSVSLRKTTHGPPSSSSHRCLAHRHVTFWSDFGSSGRSEGCRHSQREAGTSGHRQDAGLEAFLLRKVPMKHVQASSPFSTV